ncbi:TPA: hypothetical protein DCZ46_01345 [Candidatus Campbellbacteria bacterium]|nr:MAG: hypothetical protein UR74_C0001G0126 [Candidatus Campbellbacteria bacterium GW2011_GWD2_35_24]KKP76169.1 MAG: seg [Candidatus Campbellbacteria bacterium GW2011_GWC2_35_28]KKP77358.1 MAG: hypothetical protein UR76_C0001G0203 [Candidatus Campbellbacteria bacterium GW2011_GWC1_35_31]KKP79287.1 MAG: hypothetical protein UR79_C0001G0203 [Candidatus Campbellbacteria bacterium GW2011_GWD1_35_49]HAQ02247.1 hypothetical protein [Candidatus Campbellbacteria bacterium]
MKNTFAIAEITAGRLNALVKNIMDQTGADDPNEAVRLINSGEWVVSKSVRRWTVDPDGIIRFSVTGLGLTGPEMEKHLVSKGHENSDYAKQILNSQDYVPCEKGKVYNLVVLPGKLFSDGERTTENIRTDGDRRNMIHGKDLPTEIGALIRLNFTNKEIEQMGLLWLVVMHEPVKDSDSGPLLFCAGRGGDGSWLNASWDGPSSLWSREFGFVFGASQVSSQG